MTEIEKEIQMESLLPNEIGDTDKVEKRKLPTRLTAFFIGGFILSFAIDLLFWEKSFGFSYLIWVGLVLAAAGILAAVDKKTPHPSSYLLIAGIIATTWMAVWRQEPGTRASMCSSLCSCSQ